MPCSTSQMCQKTVCRETAKPKTSSKHHPENIKISYRVSEGVSLYSHFCRVALVSSTNRGCWQGSSTEMETIHNVSVVTNLFPFCLSFKINASWTMFQCCLNRQRASQHRAGKGVKIKVFTKVFQSLPIRAEPRKHHWLLSVPQKSGYEITKSTWWMRWCHFFQ